MEPLKHSQRTNPTDSFENELLVNKPNCRELEKNNNCRKNRKDIHLGNIQKDKSVNYKIKVKYQLMKYPIFQFLIDDKILFTAKQQHNSIFIGEGDEVHIKKNTSNHVAKISQEHTRTNYIIANKKRFQLKYNESEKPKHFSLSVAFPHEDKILTWNSKESKKNSIFENSNGHTVLKINKKSFQSFELETLQSIDPLIIFIIGLSGIIGPHDEPFGGF